MSPYIHRVHYYETDRMGVTHHSNYIRVPSETLNPKGNLPRGKRGSGGEWRML